MIDQTVAPPRRNIPVETQLWLAFRAQALKEDRDLWKVLADALEGYLSRALDHD